MDVKASQGSIDVVYTSAVAGFLAPIVWGALALFVASARHSIWTDTFWYAVYVTCPPWLLLQDNFFGWYLIPAVNGVIYGAIASLLSMAVTRGKAASRHRVPAWFHPIGKWVPRLVLASVCAFFALGVIAPAYQNVGACNNSVPANSAEAAALADARSRRGCKNSDCMLRLIRHANGSIGVQSYSVERHYLFEQCQVGYQDSEELVYDEQGRFLRIEDLHLPFA